MSRPSSARRRPRLGPAAEPPDRRHISRPPTRRGQPRRVARGLPGLGATDRWPRNL